MKIMTTEYKNIHEIIDLSAEELSKIPTDQLKILLAPYIPLARKAVLPQEKAVRVTAADRMMKQVLTENKDMIAQLRKLRGT